MPCFEALDQGAFTVCPLDCYITGADKFQNLFKTFTFSFAIQGVLTKRELRISGAS
jgi:hypothetical protein